MREKHEETGRKRPTTLSEKIQEEINDTICAREEKIEELKTLDKSLALLYQAKANLREII